MSDERKTEQVPASALHFNVGDIELGDNGEGAKTAPFRMVARTGQPIEHWYWGRVVHDLAGMRHRGRIPIDYAHDEKEIIGYANHFDTKSGDLVLSGALVPYKDNDRASEVVHKAKAGVPYEASINFGGDGIQVERVSDGASTSVNGFEFAGPGVVVRQWPLRGVAVCPYGADGNTSTEFSKGEQITIEVSEMSSCPVKLGANLGETIARLRDEAGITNEQLGSAAGISESTVAGIVSGEINCPPMDRLSGMASALDVSVETLINAAREDGCSYGDEEEMSAKPEALEAVESEAVLNNAEATEAVAAEVPVEAASELSEGQRFLETFGDRGGVWFAQGLSFDEAMLRHVAELREENADLQQRLQASEAGEHEPVSFNEGEAKKKGAALSSWANNWRK